MSEKKMRKCDNYAFTLLASSYPYLLIVLVGIGAYYAFNMGKIYQNSLPARLFDSSYIVKDYPIAEPKVVKAVDEAMLKNPTPQLIALGKEKFNTLCAACHGADGKGDGAAGAAMNPKPRNFHSNEGWTNGPDFLNMWKTLQEGIPSKGMAAYGVLPAEERVAMIQYIRTTFMQNAEKLTDADIKKLDDQYQITKGNSQPGTIPVSGAIARITKENDENAKKLASAISALEKNVKNDEGANLFYHSVVDYKTALSFLVENQSWKDGKDAFVKMVNKNIDVNGFKYKLLTMDDNDLEKMFSWLKALL
ncbi:MAG: cytochrome c [Ignavibacteriales bacterium]|nr:hypothetical protein [Ignavibacteriaceae bacterium]MBZ0196992.1 cytochrome c [Ignavibacteriaceae bacterium]MCZ2143803.1 cytochrome c [Ignavibacteriales bacterium]OQY69740.1 MAG: hypothetical protein B6D45_12350 [Ignavibacteriales bacterium UTCHB3]WKZ72772.1 MAG: cytochrome c [Ignavibacteriaceae bacterium]